MEFEFDPAKSDANLRKHGIDFLDVQALWKDPDRIEVPTCSSDEPRTQVIGRFGDLVWSALIYFVSSDADCSTVAPGARRPTT